jgi:hypothetical protein
MLPLLKLDGIINAEEHTLILSRGNIISVVYAAQTPAAIILSRKGGV